PAAVPVAEGRRLLVLSVGMPSSGVPSDWAAASDSPGVAFVPGASEEAADRIANTIDAHREPGDVVVASIHWGSNWGYGISPQQTRFAHALVEAGVDVVHGHSSHHPRPIEFHRGSLVLYGCGDFINDYEGISGREEYRDDLRLLFLAAVPARPDESVGLRIVPFQARRMRLENASQEDREWLRDTLTRVSGPFGTSVTLDAGGDLVAEPA
ncbi:MAG: CapA family protein, partial [Nitriliruptorales bacterium]|nr:CapA family protein [Nitriliruptorales bacterium]